MSWQTIAASETDANSPLNQTLLDKVRGNLDYLRSIGAQMKYINARFNTESSSVNVVLDAELDWRDRYVEAEGMVFQGTGGDLDQVELGGAQCNKIGNQYTGALLGLRFAHFADWMYTAAGGDEGSDNPHLFREDAAGDPDIYLWVNNANGNLMMGAVTGRSPSYRNLLCHLRLVYSEDQGGY